MRRSKILSTRTQKNGGLHVAPCHVECRTGPGLVHTRDGCDDAGGAVAELGIAGLDIDHQPVMHRTQLDVGECGQKVECCFLGRSGGKARRTGDDFRPGGEQDFKIGCGGEP